MVSICPVTRCPSRESLSVSDDSRFTRSSGFRSESVVSLRVSGID